MEAQQVLSCVARTGQRLGISMICDILRGSENERVLQMNLQTQSTYGLMREKPIFEIKRIIDALLMQELLIQTDGQYPVLKLTQNARPVLLGEKSFEMRIPVPQEKPKKPDKAAGDADPKLFARLKKLRAALAAKASVPAYVVFTDATLRDMCAKMPTDEQELLPRSPAWASARRIATARPFWKRSTAKRRKNKWNKQSTNSILSTTSRCAVRACTTSKTLTSTCRCIRSLA